jgi:hypothetical protein
MTKIIKIINIAISIIRILPLWAICIINCGITILDTVVLSLGQITGSEKISTWAEKSSSKLQNFIKIIESWKLTFSTFLGMN